MEQLEQRGEGSRSVQRATQRLQDKINNPFVNLVNSVGLMTYVRMPAWIQPVLDRGYEIATRYQIFVDFSIVFSLLFALPITIFLVWSIGSLVITMILWAVAYVAVNGLSIGMGLLCISPVFVTSLFMAFCITLIITSTRLIIYGGSNVAWHWRPRNKIWGWRRLYDEFLFSKRQGQQIYTNNNGVGGIHDEHIVSPCFGEKYYYENHNRYPSKHYDYGLHKVDNNHDHNRYYDYAYLEVPKYSATQKPQLPALRHSGRSSSLSYKSEHSHAWGTTECEEPSLTITRVRKQYSTYHSSPPAHQKINEDSNRYYSPWENKHEFEIALNKLDRYYQNLFYSKYNESFDNHVAYESSPTSYNREHCR